MKKYYVVVYRYDENGNLLCKRFVNGCFLSCLYSFTDDINDCKFFASSRSAKAYIKNLLVASREKILIDFIYDC